MTTFQYLVDAFMSALSTLLPLPRDWVESVHRDALGWGDLSAPLYFLVSWTASLYLIWQFRFDLLGLLSALIKTIVQPQSLREDRRTLDQQIMLFIVILVAGFAVLGDQVALYVNETEWLAPFWVRALTLLILAFGYHFSKNWNKRIKGLNHLKLADSVGVGFFVVVASAMGLPELGALWIGFAILNYHYEAIFKYASLFLTLRVFTSSILQLHQYSIADAFQQIGYLNGIAAVVVALTTIYLVFEHLQKTMSENTLNAARNWSIAFALYFGVLNFL